MKHFLIFVIAFTAWALHGAYHAGEFFGVKTPFGVFNDTFAYSNSVHLLVEGMIGIALAVGLLKTFHPFMNVRKDLQVADEFFDE